MKDKNGMYYHPFPSDTKTRVYVRERAGNIEFRLWRQDYPEVWERHHWLPYDVVSAAAAMYKERSSESEPLRLYDLNVAKALIRDEVRKNRER